MILLSLINGSTFARADEGPPIAPDRPGVGTPPSLVPRNHLQLEIGFSFERSAHDGATTDVYAWNQTLLRFGLLSFVELRFSTDFTRTQLEESDKTFSVSGFGAINLGAKIALWKGNGSLPDTSLLANFTIPHTGKEEYQVPEVVPSVLLLFQNALSDQLSLGYNLGWIWDSENGGLTTFYAVNLALGLSGKLTGFVENCGFLKPDGNDFFVDGGLAYLLTNQIQLDVSGGIGTRDDETDALLSLGFSWLVP